jgi:lysophospholipase
MIHESGYFHTGEGLSIRYARGGRRVRQAAAGAVLLGGRGEFIEKHEETMADLGGRGYAVYSMDWPGQGLSARLLPDRHKGHIESFSQYLDALHCLLQKIVRPSGRLPLVFLAHSMGAHLTLRYLVEKRPAAAAAALVSPMAAICTHPIPERMARRLARTAVRIGCRGAYIPGAGPYNPRRRPFENNDLTGDRQRFMDERKKIEANPSLALGGVTYGWLAAAFESIAALWSHTGLASLDVPVVMIGGSADRIVPVSAMQQLCRRLPDCRWILAEGARHEILNERDAFRNRFWEAFDRLSADALGLE